MFRRFLPIVLIVFALLLDTSVLPVFVSHWAMPLLLLCTVIVLGLLLGRTRGILYGMIAGLLMDTMVSYPLGLFAVLYLICGYISGIAGRKFQRYLLTVAVTPVICCTIFECGVAGYAYLAGQNFDGASFLHAVLRIAVETALCQLLYLVYNAILKPKWSRYAA